MTIIVLWPSPGPSPGYVTSENASCAAWRLCGERRALHHGIEH